MSKQYTWETWNFFVLKYLFLYTATDTISLNLNLINLGLLLIFYKNNNTSDLLIANEKVINVKSHCLLTQVSDLATKIYLTTILIILLC